MEAYRRVTGTNNPNPDMSKDTLETKSRLLALRTKWLGELEKMEPGEIEARMHTLNAVQHATEILRSL